MDGVFVRALIAAVLWNGLTSKQRASLDDAAMLKRADDLIRASHAMGGALVIRDSDGNMVGGSPEMLPPATDNGG